jgi:hypothetical protein
MAEQLTPAQLGQIAAEYAPNTPIELIGAVLRTESGYGTNPNAYVGNSSGAIGPGQILASQLGAKYGNFEAYYPDGDVNNPNHTTIAAVRKIADDWGKSGGNLLGFSKRYFGSGTTADGLTATNHYLPKISDALAQQGNDSRYQAFIAGAAEVRANPTMFNDNRFAASGGSFAGAAPTVKSVPTLDPDEVATASTVGAAEDIVNQLMSGQQKIADAQTAVDTVKVNQNVALARETESILTMFGLNPNVTDSEIASTATVLRQATRDLVNTQQQVAELRRDPIFNVLDTFTKGATTLIQSKRIADAQDQVKTLTGTLKELQSAAINQVNLGKTSTYALAEEEIKAQTALNQAKADDKSAALGIAQNFREQKEAAAQRLKQDRLEFDKEKAAHLQAYRDAGLAAKIAKGTPLSAAEQRQKVLYDRAEAVYTSTANALGISVDKYVAIIGDPKIPGSRTDLAQFTPGPNGELPTPLAKLKYSLGKYSEPEAELFNKALGRGGWAAMSGEGNQQYWSDEYKALVAKPGAVGKLSKDEQTKMEAEEVERIAIGKQSILVNDGTESARATNPYLANFAMLEVVSKMPALASANPIIGTAVSSDLYRAIQDKNSGNSDDKRTVSDEEVINTATELMSQKKLSPQQAGKQVSDYFRASVATNNLTEQFDKFGLPPQDRYTIPVNNIGKRTGFISNTKKTTKEGKDVNDYTLFDMTNETKVTSLLVARRTSTMGIPEFLSRLIMSPIDDTVAPINPKAPTNKFGETK